MSRSNEGRGASAPEGAAALKRPGAGATGPLRVLLCASAEAAEGLLDQLRRGGYEPSHRRVDSREALGAEARPGAWDLAICSDDLASLAAPTALSMIKVSCPDLPVIIVSSRFGESVAAAAMKAGADDFVSFGFLARLVPAVERETRVVATRREWLRATQTLRETEDLYKDLVENSDALICVHDLEGRVLTINEAVERSLGYTREEHLGRKILTLRDILASEEPEGFLRYLERLRRDGFAAGTVAVRTIRGEIRYWQYHNTVRTEGVESPIVRGLAFDVTERLRTEEERRRAEEALRESQAFLEKAQEIGQVGSWISEADDQGRLVWSKETCRIFGIPEGDFDGRLETFFDRVHPEDREAVRDAARHAVERGESYAIDHRVVRPDGTVRWVQERADVLRGSDGRAVRMVGVVQDITERRQAEEAIRSSEARYRTLFERNLAGVYRSSLDGKILECNDAFARLYGFTSREEVLARSAPDLYPLRDRRSEFLETLRRNGILTNHEGSGRRKDGSLIWTLENAVLLPEERGDGEIVEGTVVDVTDRRQLEEQLRQAQKMEAIGRLAGGVAHDFNNLLTAILGYSEIMLSQLGADDPLREGAEEIRKAGERAASLTRQLLAFSRKQRLEPKVLDFNGLVVDVEKMLRRMIGEDVDLVTALAPDLGRVKADRGQLEQVLMNLAVNARDAMPRGGKLTIQTANANLEQTWGLGGFSVQPGPYVMVAVSDTGTGMDEATKSHLFEPFFTTKGQGKGTGLGLATVYGIVKQSGGYIWVYSEPNAGTAFRIYLPRYDEPAAPKTAPAPLPGASRGRETILLVEDEEGVRALARKILAAQGYTVLEADGPRRALELLEQTGEPIDLLLTDVVMPEMDGSELASRAAVLRPATKVLFMSGYTDEAIAGRGLIAEGGRFLQKPFTPDVLAARVRAILDS